jgi:hypothetical protein
MAKYYYKTSTALLPGKTLRCNAVRYSPNKGYENIITKLQQHY